MTNAGQPTFLNTYYNFRHSGHFYLKSTIESLEFVEAIKSGLPWRVVDNDRWIMGLKIQKKIILSLKTLCKTYEELKVHIRVPWEYRDIVDQTRTFAISWSKVSIFKRAWDNLNMELHLWYFEDKISRDEVC